MRHIAEAAAFVLGLGLLLAYCGYGKHLDFEREKLHCTEKGTAK